MGVLLNRLLNILNNGKTESTYYHIANILICNYDKIKNMTISEVAELCFVSKSTISKFTRYIGFEDFSDLKSAAGYKSNKNQNILNYNDNILGYLDCHSVEDYINAIMKDLEDLKSNIQYNKIDELAKDLIKYKSIAAFGVLYSQSAAVDFQTKLAYNNKYIFSRIDDVKQHEFIRNAKENTLIIIFTNSGDYIKKYQLIGGNINKGVFKETKAKIVAITSNKELEKSPYVDLCICFGHKSSVQTHPIIYQVITDIIVSRYKELINNKKTW
ncbi:MurR/RpiR family transcriptional regulator [Clostridioides difficile]|uniref:MurR/RpiR family transcriptional regulator n=1 Tax=Clostridioides difficile TaxID=1496 RepID=UPI0010339007|nr:MurR/RpiR family transcriptional regulator [Clostridioides difficile]EGT4598475.1 MurR/RpiR family transcriptional regulator [Clostridioides difficile]MDF3815542.1 MurR/RpiR family transcriptional regulator [Clostridioides difficile]HBF4284137.1 MurR/RpiR family transcriptional regulator [Clostridioides difficile]HBF5047148.1 MurR/RpiR family transcriptional regulator [Clostridioides difficile]HBF5113610.1 MurR/RpiR family transcriptional regulator [Clostridioides difficile]